VSDQSRSRAQLLLIGSITIAVVVLTSVVLLNSIHSSPNITADSQAEALDSVDSLEGEIQQNVRELFVNTNSQGERLPYMLQSPGLTDTLTQYEESYNNFTAIDGSRVASIELTDSTSGAVAYNRSVNTSADLKYGDARGMNPEELLKNIDDSAEPPVPSVSINASGLDDQPITFGFNDSGAVTRGIRIKPDDEEVLLGEFTAPVNRKKCEFDELENVSIELRSGVGTVQNSTSTCRIGPEASPLEDLGPPVFPFGLNEISLAFREDSFEDDNDDTTFSFEISAATDNTDGCDELAATFECVEADSAPDVPLVNGEFDVEIRDPSVAYSSSFKLFPGVVEGSDSLPGVI